MGHYDNCRPGYCPSCGAAPGNMKNGVCEFCSTKPNPKSNRGDYEGIVTASRIKDPRIIPAMPKVKPPRAELVLLEPDWPSRVVDKKGLPAATAYADGWNDCLAVCKESFKRLQLKE